MKDVEELNKEEKQELLKKIIAQEKIPDDQLPKIDYARDNRFGKIIIIRSQRGFRYHSLIHDDRIYFTGVYNKKTGGYEEAMFSYQDQRELFSFITGNIKLPKIRKKELEMLLEIIQREANKNSLYMDYNFKRDVK
jgi:hypothetical protein